MSAHLFWRHVDLDHLEEIPGIGWKIVDSLRLHGYRDVADVYSASCSSWGDLIEIRGIGKKRAKELFRLIEQYVPKRYDSRAKIHNTNTVGNHQ